MTNSVKDNCLCFALRFWKSNPTYRLYYDSEHVINSNYPVSKLLSSGIDFSPIEKYGYNNISKAFNKYLDEYHQSLLEEYFRFIK